MALCDPYVAIEIDVTLSTADGLFNESLSGEVRRMEFDPATVSPNLDEPQGTFELSDAFDDPSSYDAFHGWLDITFGEEGTSGNVTVQGSGESGDVAFANNATFAQWDNMR